MQLTKNFTLEELTRSDTARLRGIDNSPGVVHVDNLRRLAETILQPVRDKWGRPITVTSGYRSPALNRFLKGASATSQHMQGEAADIISDDTPALYRLMKQMMEAGEITVGQLLDENGGSWIHVSLPNGKWKNYAKSIWT